MRKATLVFAAALALTGSVALADILLPGTAVIQGDGAKSILTQIKEITGDKGSEFRGKMVFGAKADVQCYVYNDTGETACKVIIQK